jgi:tetratricopeptide (TPR) repeat protein
MNVTECPQCGAPASQNAKSCQYCKAPFTIDSLSRLSSLNKDGVDKYIKNYKDKTSDISETESALGLGLCYLNINNYTLSTIQFKKLITVSPEVADGYYYLALSMIKGRRIKLLTLKEIRGIEELLNTAMELDSENFKYDLLLAAIKYDYYRTSGLVVKAPTEDELIESAVSKGIDSEELEVFLNLIVVDHSFSIKVRNLFC